MVVLFALAALAAASVAVAVRGDSSAGSGARAAVPSAATGEQELSPALRKKLAPSQAFSPGEPQYERGGRGERRRRARLAHARGSGTDIPLATIRGEPGGLEGAQGAGQLRRQARRPRPVGQPRAGQRGLSAQPVPEQVRLRPERVRRGRADGARRDRPELPAASCRYWIANAGGGIWRTDNALAAQPAVGVRVARVRAQQHRRARARPERLDEQHDLRRDRRAEHLPQRLHRRRRPVQVEGRRRPLEAARSATYASPAAASVDPGEAGRLVDDLRRQRRAGLARDQQHLLQRRRPRR